MGVNDTASVHLRGDLVTRPAIHYRAAQSLAPAGWVDEIVDPLLSIAGLYDDNVI